MRISTVLVFVLFLSTLAFAELNPKRITEATFRITLSGSILVTGSIDSLNLSLYIPQEGVQNVSVTADSWEYAKDSHGNRIVVLSWKNPAGAVPYSVETLVTNKAKILASEAPIATNAAYLKENDQIRFTPELREAAFPYEKTLKRAAELTAWVHNYVHYDLSYVGLLKPSDWVYENRHGVCVEFANLLSALLRISGIPTRYVNGYAYSPVENKLIGHAWVELLLNDGTWVPLDPTWLQAGYVDATHIITSVGEDANQTQSLSYSGRGSFDATWNRNEDKTELLDYTASDTVDISLSATDVPLNGHGLATAVIRTKSCTIAELNMTSCIGENGKLLNIAQPERSEWVCGEKRVYWVYSVSAPLKDGFVYTCPLGVYDQSGSQEITNVAITKSLALSNTGITGPGTAAINERFVLYAAAESDFVFFSPQLGESRSNPWVISIDKPGAYVFYLFSNGTLAAKYVNVTDKKEFSVAAALQKNVTLNGTFMLLMMAENLMDTGKSAKIRIDFGDAATERQVSFSPREKKEMQFNMTASKTGLRSITVSAMSDTISSYTASITVYDDKSKSQSFVDSIISIVTGFFFAVAGFFFH